MLATNETYNSFSFGKRGAGFMDRTEAVQSYSNNDSSAALKMEGSQASLSAAA